MSIAVEKCCGMGCEAQGVRQDGFDFFVCDNCLAELEFWLQFYGRQQTVLHEKN